MKLDLSKCNVSQRQALDLLDNMEQIEERIASAMTPGQKVELSITERDQLILQLRSTAQQLNHLAHQINLNS
jgi:hypothetical protein